jgi:hypothetical protein
MCANIGSFSDNLVQLKVGTDHATLNVHEKVLCKSSKFLKAALKKEWDALRPITKLIHLSDIKLEVVHHYLHWLYTGTFSNP